MTDKLGAHVKFSSPGYLKSALEESINYGANSMMIFLGAPHNSRRASIEKYNLDLYEKNDKKIIKENIVIHGPYITNLCNEEKFDFNVNFLTEEIKRMNYIGAKYLVIHPGSKKDLELNDALKILIKTLRKIISKTKDVEILIETMAGKGNEVCSTLEEIDFVIKEVNSKRLGVCLDTCHLYDAGYDLKNNLKSFFNKLKDLNLLKKSKVVHLNDSKNELGSHKDRHANINQGKIGLNTLKKILYSEELKNSIFILESPYVDNKPQYKEEIKLLRG